MLHQVCFNPTFWLNSSLCLLFPAVLNAASLTPLHLIYYNGNSSSTNYFGSVKYPGRPDTNNSLYFKLNYHLWAHQFQKLLEILFIHRPHAYMRGYKIFCLEYTYIYIYTLPIWYQFNCFILYTSFSTFTAFLCFILLIHFEERFREGEVIAYAASNFFRIFFWLFYVLLCFLSNILLCKTFSLPAKLTSIPLTLPSN